jgi:hypothetical protein
MRNRITRAARSLERIVLGAVMLLVARVVERRLLRAVERRQS